MSDSNPGGRATSRERRPYKPPQRRRVEFRRPRVDLDRPAAAWRARIPPALVRALIALLLGATASLEERFGSIALALECVGLGVFAALAAYLIYRSEAAPFWTVNAIDALTLVVLTPAVVLVSDVAIADSRLGGSTANFAAVTAAVVAIVVMLAIVTAALATRRLSPDAMALLPAPIAVAITLVGAERFSGAAVTDAISAAWMVAAIATVADGFAPPQARAMVPAVAFTGSAIAAAALGRASESTPMSSSNAVIAFIATAVVGIVLLLTPALARLVGSSDTTGRPTAVGGPSHE